MLTYRSICGCLVSSELETEEEWAERCRSHHVYCCENGQRNIPLPGCREGAEEDCPYHAQAEAAIAVAFGSEEVT